MSIFTIIRRGITEMPDQITQILQQASSLNSNITAMQSKTANTMTSHLSNPYLDAKIAAADRIPISQPSGFTNCKRKDYCFLPKGKRANQI